MLNEFKFIFKNKMLVVSLIAISIISLLYVALFVCSMWDSYDKSENLKICVVNKGEKATYNNKNINIGDDLVDKLKDNDKFDFQVVSEKEADKQLNRGESVGTIIVPKNASSNATTILDENPKKINLETKVNP